MTLLRAGIKLHLLFSITRLGFWNRQSGILDTKSEDEWGILDFGAFEGERILSLD
jgi:hypothetical protein